MWKSVCGPSGNASIRGRKPARGPGYTTSRTKINEFEKVVVYVRNCDPQMGTN